MINISASAAIATRFLRSRLFAVLMLSAVCAVMVLSIVIKTNLVRIIDGESQHAFLTMHTDLESILAEKNINVSSDDLVKTEISANTLNVFITRAFDVHIKCDQKTITVKMTGGTVKDALESANITLNAFDEVNLPLDTSLCANQQINIDRVDFRITTKQEEIPFGVESKKTNVLYKGQTKTVVKGCPGIRCYTYEEKLVNGQVVASTLIEEKVVKEPVTESRLVGTGGTAAMSLEKPANLVLDANGYPVNYVKVLKGKASAYTGVGQGTSTGVKTRVGYVAVDPRIIPYGTKMYIISPDGKYVYGYAIAADTGGALRSGKVLVDLFFNTESECRAFGIRNMLVYILE